MSTHLCACGEPAPESTLCGGCTRRLELLFGDVPAIVADLETTLARQGASAPRVGARRTDRPLPYDQRASDVLGRLRAVLGAWVRLVHDEQANPRPWPQDRPSAMAGWLLHEVRWLRLHDAAADCLAEVAEVVTEARRIVDRPPDRRFAGTCGHVEAGVQCTDWLYAKVGATEVVCRTCGAEHEVDERRRAAMALTEDVLVHAAEVITVLGWFGLKAHRKQLDRWIERRALISRGTINVLGRDREAYRVGDVLDLVGTQKSA